MPCMVLLPITSPDRMETLAMPSAGCVSQQQETRDTSSRVISGLGNAAKMQSEGGEKKPCGS